VVASGFAVGDYLSPVRALQRYGAITKSCPGVAAGGTRSNFLFVQFDSGSDRDVAVGQGSLLLNDSVLVSLQPLDAALADRLRFHEALEHQVGAVSGLGCGGAWPAAGGVG